MKREEDRGTERGTGEKKGFFRKRGCRFCSDTSLMIDFKDSHFLQLFVTERCKIVPRRISGNCASHQRQVCTAIKRARHLAIISYSTAQL